VVARSPALQNAAAESDGSCKLVREIPIGGEGGWDILTVESPAQRLYLSHATKVVVVDLWKSAVAGEISDTPGVHGFARSLRSTRRSMKWSHAGPSLSERNRVESPSTRYFIFFGFLQCAFEAGFCGTIRINAMITTRSANDAV
jgi:hypothetical protein